VGALIVGYLLGNYFPWNRQGELVEAKTPQVEKVQKVAPVKKAETKVVADTKPEVVEQPETPKPAEAQKPVETLKPVETPKVVETPKPVEAKKPSEAPQKSVSVAPAEVKLDKYEAKDVRVRTGAYRIVGTDHVEKVKEGDNLKRIAKRTLGPDMECYIEVYNNLKSTSELKKGQDIKIPKLELKKKKTAKK
jgi:outer membrane biosynthesis protein TonB